MAVGRRSSFTVITTSPARRMTPRFEPGGSHRFVRPTRNDQNQIQVAPAGPAAATVVPAIAITAAISFLVVLFISVAS